MSSISVIIPVFNGERYLREAIKSVVEQQVEIPLEIIVVDDGSTDRSVEIAQSFGTQVRVITQSQQGAASARNLGIQSTHADILAFLDADDYWLPNKLQLQLPYIKQSHLIFGYIQHFFSPDLSTDERNKLHCPSKPQAGYLPTTFVCQRQVFEQVGLFDSQWASGEFIEWYSKAKDLGLDTYLIEDTVAMRRIHATNHTRRQDNHRHYLKMIKATLDRRRGVSDDTR